MIHMKHYLHFVTASICLLRYEMFKHGLLMFRKKQTCDEGLFVSCYVGPGLPSTSYEF